MLIKRPSDVQPSEITPRGFYERRRELMKLAAAGSILGAAGLLPRAAPAQTARLQKLENLKTSRYSTNEPPTAREPNVNPDVDHPRWTQKRERRIPDFFGSSPCCSATGCLPEEKNA